MYCFFFFKQKTAYEMRISDWSSDVCSSDLYLIAELLGGPGKVLAVENPGYVDVRNIFGLHGTEMRPIPVDSDGMVVDERLDGCACAYVTPSHQSPTKIGRAACRERGCQYV